MDSLFLRGNCKSFYVPSDSHFKPVARRRENTSREQRGLERFLAPAIHHVNSQQGLVSRTKRGNGYEKQFRMTQENPDLHGPSMAIIATQSWSSKHSAVGLVDAASRS